jgi:hypothetical protein
MTEKQQKFLDVLYEEAEGDIRVAMRLAGYGDNTPRKVVLEPLRDEIAELTRKFIAETSTKAVYAMYSMIENPTQLGAKEKMIASKDLLDRAGFGKVDKVEVKADKPLFILPAKEDDD